MSILVLKGMWSVASSKDIVRALYSKFSDNSNQHLQSHRLPQESVYNALVNSHTNCSRYAFG